MRISNKIIVLVTFICGSVYLYPHLAHAFPTASIVGVTQSDYPKAMHHGLAVRIAPIDDPSLTAFYVRVSSDGGATWHDYDNQIKPVDGAVINLPYRGRSFSFQTEIDYKIRLCAVYGSPDSCPLGDPDYWSEGEITLRHVSGGDTDADLDYLTEEEEYNLGVDPLNPDSDEDDVADHIEIANGMDPTMAELPFINVDPMTLAFGEGNPWGDNDSQHREITIRNSGLRPLRIFNLIVQDDPAGSFEVENRTYAIPEIPVGGEVRIPVDFLPKELGNTTGTLYILSDDRQHFPVEVALSGSGTGIANLEVEGEPSLDFGQVAVGDSSEMRVVTVRNPRSDVPLNLSAFVVDTLGFVVHPNHLVISPSGSGEIRVAFAPNWSGRHMGSLRVQGGNDVEQKVLRLPISGVGTGDTPQIRVIREHVQFGTVAVGSTEKEQIRVYNDGDGTLYVRTIDQGRDEGLIDDVGGEPPFRLSSRSFIVPPRGSRPVEVTFQPQADGNFASQVCIVSNDPAVSTSERECNIIRSNSSGAPVKGGGSVRVMLYGRGR